MRAERKPDQPAVVSRSAAVAMERGLRDVILLSRISSDLIERVNWKKRGDESGGFSEVWFHQEDVLFADDSSVKV